MLGFSLAGVPWAGLSSPAGALPLASSRRSESPPTAEAALRTANLGEINYPLHEECLIAS